VVINDLAKALFQRAQQDEDNPPVRDPFLLEAIEQYNRVLALDPEDVDAHYGLHQCYRMLVGEARPAVTLPEPEKRTGDNALRSLSGVLRDGKAPREQRLEAAQRLVEATAALGREPADARMPKRMRFEALVADLRPYFAQESDPELKLAAARVLAELHRELHAIFKPDDIAQSIAVRKHRGAYPAADHAANAVVIYPLNREGAPGF
jgi:hypothetical protein